MVKKDHFLRDVRLQQEGLRRLLGDRETSIMEILWDREDVSVREIHRQLSRREDVAYTTVMTITNRLWRKGLLRRRKEGNAYLYTPTQTRESFITSCLDRIFGAFLHDLNEAALSHFVDSLAKEQPDLLEELERLLREKKTDA